VSTAAGDRAHGLDDVLGRGVDRVLGALVACLGQLGRRDVHRDHPAAERGRDLHGRQAHPA
jgi:hypothetical protein